MNAKDGFTVEKSRYLCLPYTKPKYNLIINGIDYNNELDLLGEYMKDYIDSYTTILKIDIRMLNETDIDKFFRLFKQTGLLLYDVSKYKEPEVVQLTFSQWKNHKREREYWENLDTEYWFKGSPITMQEAYKKNN